MATIKTKTDREKAKERIVDYKNSRNLAIVTSKGPNYFQPAAGKRPRKCPRKRLIMPMAVALFRHSFDRSTKKEFRLRFS